jgi:hypothetical protein
LLVAGMFVIVNEPSTAVVVLTSGDPDALTQLSQETPALKAVTVPFGTYTIAFGRGSTPFGAYTLPEMLVVALPAQISWLVQRPVQLPLTPQTLGVPPPPHEPDWQTPQLRRPPQPSATGPQFLPSCWHVFGVHSVPPQTLGVPPPPHAWGAVQVPQLSTPPQVSLTGPQFFPAVAQVFGTHEPPGGTGVPHTLGTIAPPHVWGAVHVPQLNTPPHPSLTGPQFFPSIWQVFGVQAAVGTTPHTLGTPAPPHTWGAVHVPQLRTPPQVSLTGPQFLLPAVTHVLGVQGSVPESGTVIRPPSPGCTFVPASVRPVGLSG